MRQAIEQLIITERALKSYLTDMPDDQREFIISFQNHKPGWQTKFIDGVEWKIQSVLYGEQVENNDGKRYLALWKDDERIFHVEYECCIVCLIEAFYEKLWSHYKTVQSIVTADKPNPKSPWSNNG